MKRRDFLLSSSAAAISPPRLDPAAWGNRANYAAYHIIPTSLEEIKVELQDAHGARIAGFTLADAKPLIGYAIERAAARQSGNDVSALAGKPVRLRFGMSDADLFAFRFRP